VPIVPFGITWLPAMPTSMSETSESSARQLQTSSTIQAPARWKPCGRGCGHHPGGPVASGVSRNADLRWSASSPINGCHDIASSS
jgi:hypothetical protein